MDRRIEQKPHWPRTIVAAIVAGVVLFAIVFTTFDTTTSFTLDGQRIRTAEVSTGIY